MTRSRRLYVGAVTALALLAIPQAGFGDALSLPTGSLTISANTNWQGGVIGTTGAPTLTMNSPAVATLDAGYSTLYGTGGRWNVKGNGTLLNLGTLIYSNTLNVGLSWQSSSATVINEGVVDFVNSASTDGGLYWYDTSGKFINTNGGVLQVSGGTYRFQNAGNFESYDGTIRVTNNATLWLDNNDYHITNTTFETYGTGWIRVRRTPSLVDGNAVGKALLIESGSFAADSGGTVLDVSGEGVTMGAGSWASGSGVVENRGLFTVTGSGGDQTQIPYGQVLKNTGTFKHFNTSNVGLRPYNGGRYENYGTWICSNSMFYMGNTTTFSNMAGSVFQVIGSGESKFDGTAYKFHNEGTLEVLDGHFDFEDNPGSPNDATLSGGVLKLGTWKAYGGNIVFNYTTTDITQINTNATVILSGTSTMDELDVNSAGLDTLYGTLGLHDSKTMSCAALTTDSGTVFEFGLDSGASPKLTIGGSSTLQGTVNVVDLGDVTAGSYTVIDFSSGDLTDGGLAEGTFTTSQNLQMTMTVDEGTDTVVINIAAPPEGGVYLVQ